MKVLDINEWAVSDAGPKHEVQVYVRTSGKVVWTKKPTFWVPYKKVLNMAEDMVRKHNSRMNEIRDQSP
jgi:hypothetical protein